MATSGKSAKTREIESFTSEEVYQRQECRSSRECGKIPHLLECGCFGHPKCGSAISRSQRPRILREKRHSRFSKFVAAPKTPEKRPSISWKKYRKVNNRRDIPTFSWVLETRKRKCRGNKNRREKSAETQVCYFRMNQYLAPREYTGGRR
jgi:hypothetical protein